MNATLYNENDPRAAAWLRALIAAGHIAPGVVDERSITELTPSDLHGYSQIHFFAGIGGWSLALRLAGVPDTAPVWTASCPCQPFSAAGKGLGEADPRHLWPHVARLARECRPAIILGEQVASAAGRAWCDGVRADLEEMDYAFGAADICAAGIGAPHIRQRLYWVANAGGDRLGAGSGEQRGEERPRRAHGNEIERCGGTRRLGHAGCSSHERRGDSGELVFEAGEEQSEAPQWQRSRDAAGDSEQTGGVAHPAGASGPEHEREPRSGLWRAAGPCDAAECRSPGFWSPFGLLPCRDGKSRRIEPGTFPLAHGVPARVGRLRGYGNAIVPPLAAQFIGAAFDVLQGRAAA